MSVETFSDEQLNAFVDEQLDPADRRRVIEAMQVDSGLQARIAALQRSKQLLRHAYEHPPQLNTAGKRPVHAARRVGALAFLLLLGGSLGWGAHRWQLATYPAAPTGVVIQVSENDPAKWQMALINARNVRKAYGEKRLGIEIVAYGPGLEMFKTDSAVKAGMEQAAREGVKLLACGNTMSMMQVPRAALNQSVEVVPAGVVEIMERQRDGYAYVRP